MYKQVPPAIVILHYKLNSVPYSDDCEPTVFIRGYSLIKQVKKNIVTAKQAMFLIELEKKAKAGIGGLFLFIFPKKDYIPPQHETFDEWQSNFVTETTPLLAGWGISLPNNDWDAVTNTEATWNAAWAAAKPFLASRTHPLVVAMNTAFEEYVTALRYFVQNYLAANRNVSPTQRAAIGITIRKTTRTYHPVPTDRSPIGRVFQATHLSHELRLLDPDAAESKRKPEGAQKYLVYMAIVDQDASPDSNSDFEQVGMTNNFKYISVFDDTQIGKRAFYFVKWVDSRNKEGLPSLWFDHIIF